MENLASDNFWRLLEEYKSTGKKNNIKNDDNFSKELNNVYRKVNEMMFSDKIEVDRDPGSSIFNNDRFGVGSDDGHINLCYEIIWTGKQTVEKFLEDPKTALTIAENMCQKSNEEDSYQKLHRLH